MSSVARKPVFWVPKHLYYLCSEDKGADQLRSYRVSDLRLGFRIFISKSRVSHDAAHIKSDIPELTYKEMVAIV